MTKEISKWADTAMFTAEKSDAEAGPVAYLLGAPVDPLGQIAACAKMYKGQVVRDLADVTDEERREYLEQIQKTVLKMPLEAVSLHFMVEGVHRGVTHQMVRQRTAAFAQESTRFAVKEDLASATALPVSLRDTLSLDELLASGSKAMEDAGFGEATVSMETVLSFAPEYESKEQQWRLKWDRAIGVVDETYNEMVNDGMPAEDARGLMPTNITTRLNYITNLRNFYDTMAVRVSDQAQFEWRQVAMAYAKAMRAYGDLMQYTLWMPLGDFIDIENEDSRWGTYSIRSEMRGEEEWHLVRRSSAWQWKALTEEIKPIEFKIGGPAFGANFDRPSRIGERVRAFHQMGVPSSEWTKGSEKHNIPAIHPEEWLMDPNAARLGPNQEFDIFGNRVPKGTGLHWKDGRLVNYENGADKTPAGL